MRTKHNGFTLVELLVVISIISLLSSIVLSALQSARTKGDDAQRNEIILEYTKALALYFHENGAYPPTPLNGLTLNTLVDYCLGDFDNNLCGSSDGSSEDAGIITAVRNYYPGMPTLKVIGAYEGPLYKCTLANATTCFTAKVTWRLQQSTAICVRGANKAPGPGSTVECQLTLN